MKLAATISRGAILVFVLAVAGAAQLSCSLNDYCLNCGRHGGDGGLGDGAVLDAPGDGGGSSDGGCVPTGPEVCDGVDNDCNGLVDDGVLPGVGDPCDNQMGACAGGVKQCTNGMLTCSKVPSPETCDGADNDCNGLIDEGDPGGGSKCGTDLGECIAGTNHCVGGTVVCQGFVDHTGDPELCDGKDNNCDGQFDEGLTNLGSCGSVGSPTPTCPSPPCGDCQLGTLVCQGGQPVCNGTVGPTFEACDGHDNDCDGIVDNGYDLQTDPQNCGTCGHACSLAHANAACSAGGCVIGSCKAGYHDNDGDPANGCELGPCFASGAEVCDGADNDCDGTTDEDLGAAPAICATQGECAGATATCTGAGGWTCNYGSTVSTDASGDIVPETSCDGLDNDCNGTPDDHQPNLGQACDDGQQGICRGTGTYQCDPADLDGPATCIITDAGSTPTAETCNNQDDDCDGFVDNDPGQPQSYKNAGDLGGQDWVTIGGGWQMMKYEASKPDASDTATGNVTGTVCSQADKMPWVNVTYPQALAACEAVGATLCTEQQWHRACSVVNPTTYPIEVPNTGFAKLLEAEDYSSISSGGGHAWVSDYTPGFSGISALLANPNSGTNNSSSTTALASSPRVDYKFTFDAGAAGNWRVCVYGFSPSGDDDRVWVGINPSLPGSTANMEAISTPDDDEWGWMGPSNRIAVAAGTNYLSVYMEEDGLRIDQVYLTHGSSCPGAASNPAGNQWAYATSPNTYQATTCNGHDRDAATDATLPTGSLASCYADDGGLPGGTAADHAYDLSGNVKEWTMAHQPGENPIRGGAANNTGIGIDCPLNFTLADDTFFFTNVGFRCCRPAP